MKLHVTTRDVFGKKLKSHRKKDNIPGIIYAKHIEESIPVFFNKNEFLKIYAKAGRSTVITLNWDNIDELVLVHDIEVNPVTRTLSHIDFLWVVKGQAVSAEVSLSFVGESLVEKDKLGRINYVLDSISVTADPLKLPKEIEVDISAIATMQDAIFVKDLIVSKDVTIDTDLEQVIATAVEFSNEPLETETPEIGEDGEPVDSEEWGEDHEEENTDDN